MQIYNNVSMERRGSVATFISFYGDETKQTWMKKYMISGVLMMISIVVFITQSQLVKYLNLTRGMNEEFFLLWVSHSMFSVFMLIPIFVYWKKRRDGEIEETTGFYKFYVDELHWRQPNVGVRGLFLRGLLLATICNLACYLWYLSLGCMSVSKSTAIFNSSVFFAYIFSIILLNERNCKMKWLSVIISLVGLFLLSRDNAGEGPQGHLKLSPYAGLGIISLGALLFGAYETIYKWFTIMEEEKDHSTGDIESRSQEERRNHLEERDSSIYLSFQYISWIGIATFLMHWVMLAPLHFSGLELFDNGLICKNVWFIIFNGVLSVIYNVCFLLIVSLTSPLFASIGNLITIPVSAIYDSLILRVHMGVFPIVGTLLIMIAFGFLVTSEYLAGKKEEEGSSLSE